LVENFGAGRIREKKNQCGQGDVHPRNRFKGLILNWCIGGCWFTPGLSRYPNLLKTENLEDFVLG